MHVNTYANAQITMKYEELNYEVVGRREARETVQKEKKLFTYLM
jgi:hypothetical protein